MKFWFSAAPAVNGPGQNGGRGGPPPAPGPPPPAQTVDGHAPNWHALKATHPQANGPSNIRPRRNAGEAAPGILAPAAKIGRRDAMHAARARQGPGRGRHRMPCSGPRHVNIGVGARGRVYGYRGRWLAGSREGGRPRGAPRLWAGPPNDQL